LHLWRYVGYLLGVDDVLLPADEQSAARALFMVGVSQPRPDADSVILARALHELPLRFARDPFTRRLVALEMGLRSSFTRRMLGDATADELGLPKSSMRHAVGPLVGLIRGAELLRERVPSVNRAALRWGGRIAQAGQGRIDARLKATKPAAE
jgi:hypothetical protein